MKLIQLLKFRLARILCLLLPALLMAGYSNGTKAVTTAGTRVQLSTDVTSCVSLTVQVLSTNAGTIWIGGTTVSASGKVGLALTNGATPPASAYFSPSATTALYALSAIWLDATNSGDGVTWACYK